MHAILLTQEDEANGETECESDPPASPLNVVSEQVTREENFGREQKTDCQVLEINGENQYLNQAFPMADCLIKEQVFILPLKSLGQAL